MLNYNPSGIVKSGSSGTDYWVLFADNTLIKYGTFNSASLLVSTGEGYQFRTSASATLTFNTTIPFTTNPVVTFSVNSAYTIWVGTTTISTTTCTYQLRRGSTNTVSTVYGLQYCAIGRG
jgi:hypothetical protein